MARLQFISREPPRPVVVYLDNFRLVDDKQRRLEAMLARLSAATKSLAALEALAPGTPARHSAAVAALRGRGETLREQLARADDPGAREALGGQLRRLRARVDEAIEAGAEQAAGVLARTYLPLASPPAAEYPKRRPLRAPARSAADTRADALGELIDRAEAHRARVRLEGEIERRFPKADFAIGIPPAPRTFVDRPRDYDGPLGRSVRLRAARHETEPFQLVLLPRGKPLRGVHLSATPLTGPGVIGAEHVEIAPMGWRKSPDGAFRADMLRPRIKTFDVAADAQQPVWVNVYVPRHTPPGEYTGTITIEADGATPQQVAVNLTVWPFTLPKYPSIHSAIDGWPGEGEHADAYARFLLAHRLNPTEIYRWPLPPKLETMQRWHAWGGSHFNLLRISRLFASFKRNKQGELRVQTWHRKKFFAKLDPRMKEIKEAKFLDRCMLFGFDELNTQHAAAMNDLYGQLKQRYGPIKTMAAINLPLWKQYPRIEHLDVWCVEPPGFELDEKVRDMLKAQGKEIWWYNLYADQINVARCRAQFWATFKDGFDGVLHYSLSTGGWRDPRGPGLYPPELPDKAHRYGGILRRDHEGLPVSSVALEYWREGLEDCDYLALLRTARDRLAKKADPGNLEQRDLIRRADRMLSVPDYITLGLIGGIRMRRTAEITAQRVAFTDDPRIILEARRQVAELIVRINARNR